MTVFNNHNFISFDGTPITGRTPTKTIVMAESGHEMSPQLRGAVAHAYKLFCDAVNVSAFPNGYHLQNRNFTDGSKVRMESNNGIHQVMVWPVGFGGKEYQYVSGIIVDLLETTQHADYWDGVLAPVVSRGNSVKKYPEMYDGNHAILVEIDSEAILTETSFTNGHIKFYKVPRPSSSSGFLTGDMNHLGGRKMVLCSLVDNKVFTFCGSINLPSGCGDLLFSTGLQPGKTTTKVTDLSGALYMKRNFGWASSTVSGITTTTSNYEYQLVTVVRGVANPPVVIGSGIESRTSQATTYEEEHIGHKLSMTEDLTSFVYTNEARLYEGQPCSYFTITIPKNGDIPVATQSINQAFHSTPAASSPSESKSYEHDSSITFVGSGIDSFAPYEDYSISVSAIMERSRTSYSSYKYEIDPWDGSFNGLGFATYSLAAYKIMHGNGSTTSMTGSFSGTGPRVEDNFSLSYADSCNYSGSGYTPTYGYTAPFSLAETHLSVLSNIGAESSRESWLMLRKTWSGTAGATTSVSTGECAIILRNEDGSDETIVADARSLFENEILNAYSAYNASTPYRYYFGGFAYDRQSWFVLNGPYSGDYFAIAKGWGAGSIAPLPTTTVRFYSPYDTSRYASFTSDPLPSVLPTNDYETAFKTLDNLGEPAYKNIVNVTIEEPRNTLGVLQDAFYQNPNVHVDMQAAVRNAFTPDISDVDSRIFHDRRNGTFLLQLALSGYMGTGTNPEMYLGLYIGNKNGITDFEPILNDWLSTVTYSDASDQATYGGLQYERGEVAIALWNVNSRLTRYQPPLY